MGEIQGTYQYWGARILTWLNSPVTQNAALQMQVDSSARLWVDGTLTIDATCMFSATLLILCHLHAITRHVAARVADQVAPTL